MGIYIRLAPVTRISNLDKAQVRLHYCREIVRYFEEPKFFKPIEYEIWLKATSTTLGGELLDRREITNTYEAFNELTQRFAKAFLAEELFSSIVVVHGDWNFNNCVFSGFVSCNHNSLWRKTYQDIETDIYGAGDIGDLTDVFLDKKFFAEKEFEGLVQSFIAHIKRVSEGKTMLPTPIYFSIGASEYGETTDLVVLHLGDWQDLIRFFYKKLRRGKDHWVRDNVAPLDKNFYVKSITEPEIAKEILTKTREETSLLEKVGQSVTYIGKDRNSFNEYYERVKKNLFKPASKELPTANHLKEVMELGLKGKRITTF